MIKGSCLCGAVQFEIDEGHVLLSNNCYCANCRKSSGAQFATFLQMRPDHFRWIAGQDKVAAYESSPGNKRFFCSQCGSTAPGLGNLRTVRVPGGALDADPGVKPEVNMYAPSRAAWCSSDGARPLDEAGPQDFWDEFVRRYMKGGR